MNVLNQSSLIARIPLSQIRSQLTLIGLCCFVIVNIPSIKLFTGPTLLLNIGAVILLVSCFFIRLSAVLKHPKNIGRINCRRSFWTYLFFRLRTTQGTAYLLLVAAFVITALPELVGIRDPAPLYLYLSAGLLFVIGVTGVFFLATHRGDIKSYIYLQVAWGTLLAVLYLAGLVQFSESLEQHYNTIALPISIGAVALSGWMIAKGDQLTTRDLILVLSILSTHFIALLLLGGRIAFVGGALAIGFTIAQLSLWSGYNLRKVVILSAGVSVVGSVLSLILYIAGFLSSSIVSRWTRLFYSTSKEPRVRIYSVAIENIFSNPTGQGLGAFDTIIPAEYPHNLFLHIAFSGGWLALLLFSLSILLLFLSFYRASERDATPITIALYAIVIYLLIVFSVSYSIIHVYMLLVPLIMGGSKRYKLL